MEQQKFIATIEILKDMALANGGRIKKSEIDVKMREEGMELNESQLKMVYAYLKTSKIEVVNADGESVVDLTAIQGLGAESDIEGESEAGKNADKETLDEKDDEVVKMYQADIKHVPVLSEEELLVVMKRIADVKSTDFQNNNSVKADKEAIINTFLKEVVRWVKNYRDSGVLMTDLIQEGNIGLMSAVDSFDYLAATAGENPVKALKAALKKSVVASVQNEIFSQESENNVGYKIAGRVNAVNDCAKELAEDMGRKVSIAEVAEKMEMEYEEVKEIIDLSSNKIEYIDYF